MVKAASKSRRDLAENDHDTVRAEHFCNGIDEPTDASQVAFSRITGRNVRGDVDDIAFRQMSNLIGKALLRSICRQKLRQTGFDDWKRSICKRRCEAAVSIIANDRKPSGGDCGGGDNPEMGHASKTDRGQLHANASFANRVSVR